MAAAQISKNFINAVRACPANVQAAAAGACSVPVRSSGGVHKAGHQDVWWNPAIPLGHSPFSWAGASFSSAAIPEVAAAAAAAEVPSAAAAPAAAAEQEAPKEKKQKEKKEKKPKAAPEPKVEQPIYSRLDFRVGHVIECKAVPDSDRLIVSKIDVGESEPRQIVSGLKAYYSPEQVQGTKLITVCNLKPSPLMGITSYGMVLCAKEGEVVEIIRPCDDAKAGEPILLEGENYDDLPKDVDINAKKKNSAWALIAPLLKTDGELFATCDGKRLMAAGKYCSANTLPGAPIS